MLQMENILQGDSRIQIVEKEQLYKITSDPTNDPLYKDQWGLHKNSSAERGINSGASWSLYRGNESIVIAIIDTGVDYLHPDLTDNMWNNPKEIPNNNIDDDKNGYKDDVYGWDFHGRDGNPMDGNSHGTLVAGVVGARGDNHLGGSGVIQRCKLMALKGLSDDGFGYTSDLAEAIIYAVDNGARVINASWGGGGFSPTLFAALEYAKSHDVVFVAAAGNSRRNNDDFPFYPASYELDNIVSVGATEKNGIKAGFSHFGKNSVDIFAPGVGILSTAPGGGYFPQSGTSLAAPFVTGAFGLLISSSPNWTYLDYQRVIYNTVHKSGDLNSLCKSGGILDIYSALNERHEFPRRLDKKTIVRSLLSLHQNKKL